MSASADTKEAAKEGKDTETQVHSANSWETADLGDKQRNDKFLRLMGASKKEHHGKFVIGDNTPAHKRERVSQHRMQEDLEEQFEAGMEHRLAGGRKGHLGLGFQTEAKDSSSADDKPKEACGDPDTPLAATGKPVADACGEDEVEETPEDTNAPPTKVEKREEKDKKKRESSDTSGDKHDQVKKMKFVAGDS